MASPTQLRHERCATTQKKTLGPDRERIPTLVWACKRYYFRVGLLKFGLVTEDEPLMLLIGTKNLTAHLYKA